MSNSPYQGIPSIRFWSAAVAKSTAIVPDGLYNSKWPIEKNEKIATAGSCFAQHIGRYLKRNGFHVLDMEPPPLGLTPEDQTKFGFSMYSARYGNIYTTRQLLQLAREAFGEWAPGEIVWASDDGNYYDAMRPGVEPEGLGSAAEVLAHRKYHLARVREMFETMDLFIFTLGLTEAWIHSATGTVFPTAPGTIAGSYDPAKYEFKNFLFDEVWDDFNAFRDLIHSKQTKSNKAKFLLTVSPVPLTATASDNHVLLATTYSKSVLRAVAGQLSLHLPDIDYFPSYEIISNPWSRTLFYEANLRSVKESGVEAVMQTFFTAHLSRGADDDGATTTSNVLQERKTEIDDYMICEEAILDAFAKGN
jgi:hypothetical protein